MEVNWKDGQLNGVWKLYTKSGGVIDETHWKDGEEIEKIK